MPPAHPFVDPETETIDTARMLLEVRPLAKLIGGVGAIALVPYATALTLFPYGTFGVVLTVASLFLLALGAAIVLLYVVTRAIQLAESSTRLAD